MEALQNRAELLLLKCRKELYFDKLDELKRSAGKSRMMCFAWKAAFFQNCGEITKKD